MALSTCICCYYEDDSGSCSWMSDRKHTRPDEGTGRPQNTIGPPPPKHISFAETCNP